MAGLLEAASGALTALAFFSALARFAELGVIEPPPEGEGAVITNDLLLETGSYLLLETGNKMILEP